MCDGTDTGVEELARKKESEILIYLKFGMPYGTSRTAAAVPLLKEVERIMYPSRGDS